MSDNLTAEWGSTSISDSLTLRTLAFVNCVANICIVLVSLWVWFDILHTWENISVSVFVFLCSR